MLPESRRMREAVVQLAEDGDCDRGPNGRGLWQEYHYWRPVQAHGARRERFPNHCGQSDEQKRQRSPKPTSWVVTVATGWDVRYHSHACARRTRSSCRCDPSSRLDARGRRLVQKLSPRTSWHSSLRATRRPAPRRGNFTSRRFRRSGDCTG